MCLFTLLSVSLLFDRVSVCVDLVSVCAELRFEGY